MKKLAHGQYEMLVLDDKDGSGNQSIGFAYEGIATDFYVLETLKGNVDLDQIKNAEVWVNEGLPFRAIVHLPYLDDPRGFEGEIFFFQAGDKEDLSLRFSHTTSKHKGCSLGPACCVEVVDDTVTVSSDGYFLEHWVTIHPTDFMFKDGYTMNNKSLPEYGVVKVAAVGLGENDNYMAVVVGDDPVHPVQVLVVLSKHGELINSEVISRNHAGDPNDLLGVSISEDPASGTVFIHTPKYRPLSRGGVPVSNYVGQLSVYSVNYPLTDFFDSFGGLAPNSLPNSIEEIRTSSSRTSLEITVHSNSYTGNRKPVYKLEFHNGVITPSIHFED